MRKLCILAAITVVGGLAVLGVAQAGDPPLTISCGATVTAGTWTVTNSIAGCGAVGLTISSNVNLNCNNHTIAGTGGTGNGIFLSGVKNIHITNCHVKNFANNFEVLTSTNVSLRDNTSLGATDSGIGGFVLGSSNGNTLNGNIATAGGSNHRGFLFFNSNNNTVANNIADGNAFRGFDFNGTGNNVSGNTALNNGSSGFVVSSPAAQNVFTGNRAISNASEGFSVFSSGNTFTSNAATGNGISPDCQDTATNNWGSPTTNVGDTASPSGICLP